MSHNSDKSLSLPLSVDTEDNNTNGEENLYYKDSKEKYNHTIAQNDSLGPLPPKWEKAYTESGEIYFIDHSTGTSHWLDPRLSKFQKKLLEDCLDDELPYGWEKISDPHYGTYFIDHVNRRTQYENPVIQAKRAASQASARVSTTSFTRDPSELCGQRFRTSLVKSSRGLGFTIVGGDDGIDEFLQIKSVVPKGPAWLDGKLQMGDIIVYVNDTCVLGYTHNQIVYLFQSITVGSTVAIEVCRGYPLPFDPNDPNTEVVTTIAVDSNLQTLPNEKCLGTLDTNYNFLDGDISHEEQLMENAEEIDELLKGISMGKVEVRVCIVKGAMGFGFTIADSACGQRVKKILDRQRCKNLMEGDILLEINDVTLQTMTHDEVVQVLKNCPFNSEATISVQRGCNKIIGSRNNSRSKLDNRFVNKEGAGAFRSKTPTADIYSTQSREILPSRPKTPIVDTRNIKKSSLQDMTRQDMNSNSEYYKRDYVNENFDEKSHMCLSLADNQVEDELNGIQNNQPEDCHAMYMTMPHLFDCLCYNCQNNTAMLEGNNYMQDWRRHQSAEFIEYTVTLHRQESGFGFRIIGGIEDRSQVAVGHIVQGGSADMDGRIRSGDKLLSVDGFSVVQAAHRQVVQLMNTAATRGQVILVLGRPVSSGAVSPGQTLQTSEHCPQSGVHIPITKHSRQTYDIIVNRNENEGFGFVIISSVNKAGSTIGRLIEDSPAERCGRLRVGDYILAVNHIDIMQLSHGDIVNLIKDSGLSVTLTIAPNIEQ